MIAFTSATGETEVNRSELAVRADRPAVGEELTNSLTTTVIESRELPRSYQTYLIFTT